jgi:hypothetical protein
MNDVSKNEMRAASGHDEPNDDVLKSTGFPANYGQNPNVARDDKFEPDWIGIVHIKNVGGWEISVNHAAFSVAASSGNESRLARALEILREKGRGTFADLKGSPNYEPFPRDGHYDSINFDKYLGFRSKNELFIFIEGDVEVVQGALLSFTPLGADLRPRDKNFAFFNAKRVDPDELAKYGLVGRMIRVRNYMTTEDGKPIGDGEDVESELYSMNIHFTVPGKGGVPVPMIIDPDTGNGMGNNP